jgi:hypothetical protein
MDQLIAATVVIGDRSYRIKIDPADEEMVRRTVKTINDKVVEFKTQFAGKDMQDYIAMVLIWLSTERSEGNHTEQASSGNDITNRLDMIERLLDNRLA